MKRMLWMMMLVSLAALFAACGGDAEPASSGTGTDADTSGEEMSLDDQLVAAVNAEDVAEVDRLLSEGADASVEEADDFFSNPILRTAVVDGNVEITRLLIENGADVNARDSKGNSVLRRAITEGHPELVALLIDAGADATAVEGDDNALLPLAVQTGDIEVVRMLLDAGADVNDEASTSLVVDIFNMQFQAPGIHAAAARGMEDILQLLIDNGADVNQSVSVDGENAWPPLTFAAVGNHVEMIDLLVANGAEIEGKTEDVRPLVMAVTNGQREATLKLIELGADLSRRDEVGNILLGLARNWDHEEIVEILLEAGAEE
jgi:ankyrin repeat protein